MRHHYWEWPIPTYLFLGGLGGGIFCLIMILSMCVYPTEPVIPAVLTLPALIGIGCIGFGTVMLVVDLGQPAVFYRAFIKSTSVLAWGARLLTICAIFSVLWFCSFLPWDWWSPIANFLAMFRALTLFIAGVSGTCIMLYTGIFLSTLKAHAFWATPALPVLFTVSALSTACAAITIFVGGWPFEVNTTDLSAAYTAVAAMHVVREILHVVDIILVAVEIVVLLVMVLSFLGAGNKTANQVAHKWVHGSYAPFFWVGMMGIGLVIPEFIYIFLGGIATLYVAPIMILCGGLLLRFLVVNSDERAPLPGENRYYNRLVSDDAEFLHKWTYGENLF